MKRKNRLTRAFAGFFLGAVVGWIITAVALAIFDADVLINNPSSPLGPMRDLSILLIIVYSFVGAGFGAVVGLIIALVSSSPPK